MACIESSRRQIGLSLLFGTQTALWFIPTIIDWAIHIHISVEVYITEMNAPSKKHCPEKEWTVMGYQSLVALVDHQDTTSWSQK